MKYAFKKLIVDVIIPMLLVLGVLKLLNIDPEKLIKDLIGEDDGNTSGADTDLSAGA